MEDISLRSQWGDLTRFWLMSLVRDPRQQGRIRRFGVKWSPRGGRSLHDLQINLLRKAVSLVRPGGVIVYSTCSLDPIENEAVVAEIIRTEENLELLPVSEIIPNLPGRDGFSSWPDIDDDAMPSSILDLEKSMTSPVEDEISESLKKCMRIWHDDIGGGGFFISVIKSLEICQ